MNYRMSNRRKPQANYKQATNRDDGDRVLPAHFFPPNNGRFDFHASHRLFSTSLPFKSENSRSSVHSALVLPIDGPAPLKAALARAGPRRLTSPSHACRHRPHHHYDDCGASCACRERPRQRCPTPPLHPDPSGSEFRHRRVRRRYHR